MAGKKKSKKKKRMKFIVKMLLLLSLITFLILGIIFYLRYGEKIITLYEEADLIVAESQVETFRQTETSLVYDAKGNLLSVLKGEKDVYYINYEDIPEVAKAAMIAIEDKKFESHNGIDMKANFRAFVELIKHKGKVTQGASTITQQLSRNIFLTHEVSVVRKVKEIFIALKLEKKYEKYQIMEFYLNNIYFGNGYYGIQAASNGYFSKSVKELTLGEIVFLCAIPNNPTLYDPMVNMDNTIGRKNRILDQMLSDGKISIDQYNDAYETAVTLNVKKIAKKNYIETYIYYCATKALMENQGFIFMNQFDSDKEEEEYKERYDALYTQCQQSLFSSGYRIYTSIDKRKQKKLQKAVNEKLKKFTVKNKEGIYELQGASVCIDNKTGKVVAVVGGRSQNTVGYTLNRAFQSFRQPGSSIKPLIVYTPALEDGYTPDTIVEDKKFEGGPKNSGDTYSGRITLRRAVEASKNTVAWQVFSELTPKVGLKYVLNMKFQKISKNDYYPASALGGLTKGVSPVEMASAFATLENDGVFRSPTCILKIMDSKGNQIIEEKTREKVIYNSNAARMMTDILTGVITNGTGRGLGFPGMAIAGKTGTTDDKKDGWFVGYTPYYTTSVWVGYDMPKELDDLYGGSYPGQIWKQFMEDIHKGLKDVGFKPYYVEEKATSTPIATPEKAEEEPVEEEEFPPEEEFDSEEEDFEEEDGGFEEDPLSEEEFNEEEEDNFEDEENPIDDGETGDEETGENGLEDGVEDIEGQDGTEVIPSMQGEASNNGMFVTEGNIE